MKVFSPSSKSPLVRSYYYTQTRLPDTRDFRRDCGCRAAASAAAAAAARTFGLKGAMERVAYLVLPPFFITSLWECAPA